MRRALLAAGFLLAACGANAAAAPQRIVSMNLCADELVLRLADPGRIASVTWLSRESEGPDAHRLAARIPVNHGLAEEVLRFDPDLVLAGVYTTRIAADLLERAGMTVRRLQEPNSLAEAYGQIREVAALLGAPERGERMIAAIEAGFAAIEPSARAERVIVLRPNGFAVGRGTLVDDVLARAGLVNLAAAKGIDDYGQMPLESVILEGADILMVDGERDGPPSIAAETLRHPVLAALAGRIRVVVVPPRLLTCPGPGLVEAAALLARAARAP